MPRGVRTPTPSPEDPNKVTTVNDEAPKVPDAVNNAPEPVDSNGKENDPVVTTEPSTIEAKDTPVVDPASVTVSSEVSAAKLAPPIPEAVTEVKIKPKRVRYFSKGPIMLDGGVFTEKICDTEDPYLEGYLTNYLSKELVD